MHILENLLIQFCVKIGMANKFRTRLKLWLKENLIALDQWLHVLLGGPKYLLGNGPLPSADETISSKVGKAAIKGKIWALICEKIINGFFFLFGDKNHCRNSIEWGEGNSKNFING